MNSDPGDEWTMDDRIEFSAEGLRRLAEAVFGKEPITESEYDEKIAPAIMDYLRERK